MPIQGHSREASGQLESAMPIVGRHICVDLYDCDPALLDEPESIQQLLIRAATAAGARVLEVSSHSFSPRGLTTVLLLAESHLALHTWPEHRFAAMDIFTCGPSMRPDAAVGVIKTGLGARSSRGAVIDRGGPAVGRDDGVNGHGVDGHGVRGHRVRGRGVSGDGVS